MSDKEQRPSTQADGDAPSADAPSADALSADALSDKDLEQVSGGQPLQPVDPSAPPPFIGDWTDDDLSFGIR